MEMGHPHPNGAVYKPLHPLSVPLETVPFASYHSSPKPVTMMFLSYTIVASALALVGSGLTIPEPVVALEARDLDARDFDASYSAASKALLERYPAAEAAKYPASGCPSQSSQCSTGTPYCCSPNGDGGRSTWDDLNVLRS